VLTGNKAGRGRRNTV